MDKENLIVCGCSFTKGHFLSEYETWGGYVAKKLNLNLHNIAQGGSGNEWISQKVISYFLNNPELKSNSVVMIGWSDVSRLMGTFERENGYIECVTIQPQDFDENYTKNWPDNSEIYHGYVKKNHKYLNKFFKSFAYCIYKSYYSIYVLKQYLESNNIPYIFFDAINPIKIEELKLLKIEAENSGKFRYCIKTRWMGNKPNEIEEDIPNWIIDDMLNTQVESQIFDTPKYISFDGMSMNGYLNAINQEYFNELTFGNDTHPNEKAADLFSDMIIKEYERLYNK